MQLTTLRTITPYTAQAINAYSAALAVPASRHLNAPPQDQFEATTQPAFGGKARSTTGGTDGYEKFKEFYKKIGATEEKSTNGSDTESYSVALKAEDGTVHSINLPNIKKGNTRADSMRLLAQTVIKIDETLIKSLPDDNPLRQLRQQLDEKYGTNTVRKFFGI